MHPVVIVILNWNNWRDTIACMESVLRLKYPDYQVLVCDNASSDDSMQRIRAWMQGNLSAEVPNDALSRLMLPPVSKPVMWREIDCDGNSCGEAARVTLIQTGSNLGFAGGNNVGLRYALKETRADYVWLLNNDTLVEPDALNHLMDRARHSPEAGMVGSALCYMSSPEKLQALGGASFTPWRCRGMPLCANESPDPRPPAVLAALESQLAYIIGASMLVSRSFLETVGLMQSDYFLYYEEIDWASRAKGRFTMTIAPLSRVYHKVGGSAGTDVSLFSLKFLARNQLLFTSRFYPHYLFAVRLQMLLDGAKNLVKARWAAAALLLKTAISPVFIPDK